MDTPQTPAMAAACAACLDCGRATRDDCDHCEIAAIDAAMASAGGEVIHADPLPTAGDRLAGRGIPSRGLAGYSVVRDGARVRGLGSPASA